MTAKEKNKAKESAGIKRARLKIQRQIETQQQLFNSLSLEKMKGIIKRELERRQGERIDLKERNVKVQTANRYAKTHSKFILTLIDKLEHPHKNKKSLNHAAS